MKFSRILGGLAVAAFLGLTGAALAQQQQAVPQPTDVKNIGDYVVRCFPVQSPYPCDMYQQADDKNTGQRVLSFSLAFVPSANRYVMLVSVPLGVSIQKGLIIQTNTYTSPALKFRRCDRGGCYVETLVEKATVDALAKSAAAAKIKIVANNGSEDGKGFDINFSLNGFTSAHDAMAELARAKAKPIPAQPAAAPAPAPETAPAAP